MKNNLAERWNKLWRQLGCTKNMEPLFHELCKAYGENHRAYHDLSHIRQCLEEFDSVQDRLAHPDEVELAIWFHDIVYDPESSRNEEDSASYAAFVMKKASVDKATIRKVMELILATRHDGADGNSDALYLMDIDIATFGSTPETYWKYEERIRKEHEHVPESVYREKRKEVLTSFLQKEQIYHTAFFRSKYAHLAVKNLDAAIKALNADEIWEE